MEDRLSGSVCELQSLVSLLSQENLSLSEDSRLEELGDRLLGLLEGFPRHSEHSQMRGQFSAIHAAAVSLWNLAVAFRASGNTRKAFVAQLRHVSLGLVLLSEPPSPQVSHLKKLLAMSLKTSRSWLDAGNFVMADAAIVHGWEQADRLSKSAATDPETAAVVAATKVRLLACKSEAWLGLSEQERALDCIGQAKQLLPLVSQSERAWVSVHCYNLGLGLYRDGAHGQSLSWLKESYETGRQGHCVEAVKQARTLRLIALAYLECDPSERDWLKSLNTAELSLTEHVHPSGLFLKLRVLLYGRQTSGGQEMQIRSALLDLIRCPDSELELCLTAVRITADTAGLSDLAFLSLSALREFHGSTPDTDKCILLQLELLLRSDRLEEGVELLAGSEFGFEGDTSKRLIMLIWDEATRLVETARHNQAIILYDHCIARYSSCGLGETNLAKLHRNRASCLLELGKLEEAQEAFQMALKFCPSSAYTHYIGYKLAILLEKSALAGQHLSNMISSHRTATDGVNGEVSIEGLLSLAVQVAFESGNKLVACSALEQLVLMGDGTSCDALSALRCLVRLKLTLMEGGEEGERVRVRGQVVKLLETALLHLRKKSMSEQENISLEVSWFSKVAWNMALQSHTDYSAMKRFFALSMRLNSLSPLDPSVQSRQKSCLVGASAASLKYLKGSTDESEVKSVAEEVLGFVDQGKKLCGRGGQPDSSLVFFHLFEFEAKHRLGYQNLGKCLEDIALLPASDSKIFEAIASIASNGNTHSKRLAVKSLQLSLERLKASESSLDLTKQAEIHHSLVSILLSNEMLVDTAGREAAFRTFKQILTLVESGLNGKQRYPEIDVVWLMTKCWNLGVVQYSKQQFVEAERHCGLALKFLYQLTEMKSAYEATMTDVYSEILAKLPESSDCIIPQQPEL